LLFAKASYVAFTNNRAERDLRQAESLRLLQKPPVRRSLFRISSYPRSILFVLFEAPFNAPRAFSLPLRFSSAA
jgi:hypothetical protein